MHRHVPKPPVLANRRRVPPIFVKLAIAEARQLRDDVQPQVKEHVEDAQPHIHERQAQLEHAFYDTHDVGLVERPQRVQDRGLEVLIDDKQHEADVREQFEDSSEQPVVPDSGRV